MEKTEKNDSYSHILKYTGIFGSVQGVEYSHWFGAQ